MGDEIEVKLKDLSKNSNLKVKVKCDYCGDIIEKSFVAYNKQKEHTLIDKDCCNKCKTIKTNETILLKYGVNHNFKLDTVKKQKKLTFKEKYGVDNPAKCNIVKEKIKQTNLQRYGVEWTGQNEKVRDKMQKTLIKNYGCKYTFHSEEIKQKIKETMYKKGTAKSSIQQRYLCNLFNGKLNYPVLGYNLDIAFPNEMLYIEYDGSGHHISIKRGMSESKFKQIEMKRNYTLKNKGWKLIRIISTKDMLPEDNVLIDLLEECKNYLNTGHYFIYINIDKKTIRCSQYEKQIDLYNLRFIHKSWDNISTGGM